VSLGFAALAGNSIKQLAYNNDDDDRSRCHHRAQSNKNSQKYK